MRLTEMVYDVVEPFDIYVVWACTPSNTRVWNSTACSIIYLATRALPGDRIFNLSGGHYLQPGLETPWMYTIRRALNPQHIFEHGGPTVVQDYPEEAVRPAPYVKSPPPMGSHHMDELPEGAEVFGRMPDYIVRTADPVPPGLERIKEA